MEPASRIDAISMPRGTRGQHSPGPRRRHLERAHRADQYVQAELKNVSPARLQKAFTQSSEGTYSVRPEVRDLVDIRLHNLLTDPPMQGFDLIHCRNVVIYRKAEATATAPRPFVRPAVAARPVAPRVAAGAC